MPPPPPATIDAVLVVFTATLANGVPATLAAVAAVADRATVPVAVVLLGVPDHPDGARHPPGAVFDDQAHSRIR